MGNMPATPPSYKTWIKVTGTWELELKCTKFSRKKGEQFSIHLTWMNKILSCLEQWKSLCFKTSVCSKKFCHRSLFCEFLHTSLFALEILLLAESICGLDPPVIFPSFSKLMPHICKLEPSILTQFEANPLFYCAPRKLSMGVISTLPQRSSLNM